VSRGNRFKIVWLVALLVAALSVGCAASPLAGTQVLPIKTESAMLPGTIDGQKVELAATIYRPADMNAPLPTILLTHGRRGHSPARNPKESQSASQTCTALAEKGFVVVYVARSGYGTSTGPDFEGRATQSAAYKLGMEGEKSIAAAVKAIRQLPYVDPAKVVVGGLSVGGLSTMAAASQNLEGVIGYVNFAGFPVEVRDQLGINSAFAQYAKTAKVPSLWLYSSGDQFLKFVDIYAVKDSFVKSGGQCKLVLTRYVENGHMVMNRPADWMNYMDSYLDSIGLSGN